MQYLLSLFTFLCSQTFKTFVQYQQGVLLRLNLSVMKLFIIFL